MHPNSHPFHAWLPLQIRAVGNKREKRYVGMGSNPMDLKSRKSPIDSKDAQKEPQKKDRRPRIKKSRDEEKEETERDRSQKRKAKFESQGRPNKNRPKALVQTGAYTRYPSLFVSTEQASRNIMLEIPFLLTSLYEQQIQMNSLNVMLRKIQKEGLT